MSQRNENSSSYIDLHMLIPCSINQESSLTKQDYNNSSLLWSMLYEKINYSINNEFKGDFVKKEKRGTRKSTSFLTVFPIEVFEILEYIRCLKVVDDRIFVKV